MTFQQREKLLARVLIISGIFVSFCFLGYGQENKKLDYLIKDALVFDGTKNVAVQTDVGIKGDRIVYIGNSENENIKAVKVIDADGLYLSPGFIDPHTHYGRWLNSKMSSKRENMPCLSQGVTTVVLGSDGFGTYKIAKKREQYNENGIGTNAAFFVGFSSVRRAILGSKDITPNKSQLKQMRMLVAKGMKEGAFGLSTGLFYTPQSYSTTGEVIALAGVAEKYNGIYDTHMRSESNGLVKAVQETIDIGKATGIPLMISHIKCLGPAAWGKSDEIIRMVQQAHDKGIKLIASQYPYYASYTSLKAMLIPPWVRSGGVKEMIRRFENPDTLKKVMKGLSIKLAIRGGDSRIMISSKKNPDLNGKTLHQIAMKWGTSPEEATIRLLSDFPSTSAVSFSMEESDVVHFMEQPWVVTGSDGGGGHPRTYGTFVRKIRKYAREENILTMAEVIHRSTGETAEFLGLKKRGFIKKGYFADIVLFNPEKIMDNSTFTEPTRKSSGIEYVFVNGILSYKEGKSTGKLAGEALKHEP